MKNAKTIILENQNTKTYVQVFVCKLEQSKLIYSLYKS